MYRKVFLTLVMLLVAAQMAHCAPSLSGESPLPVLPDGKIFLRVDLSQEDFVPAIRNGIVKMMQDLSVDAGGNASANIPVTKGENPDPNAGTPAPSAGKVPVLDEKSIEQVRNALAGLTDINAVAYKLCVMQSTDAVCTFYVQRMKLDNGWTKLIRLDLPTLTAMAYQKKDQGPIFALFVSQDCVVVAETKGRVDIDAIKSVALQAQSVMQFKRRELNTSTAQPGSIPQPQTPSPGQAK